VERRITWQKPRASVIRCRWSGLRKISETRKKVGVMEYWNVGVLG
jgi:hypothetical protein